MKKQLRPDHTGSHRVQYETNKKKLLKMGGTCGICGQPIDMTLKYPHPLSACIDHIIPIARGGHPSAMENLQLAHLKCNNAKGDKFMKDEPRTQGLGNRDLPWSRDWLNYKA